LLEFNKVLVGIAATSAAVSKEKDKGSFADGKAGGDNSSSGVSESFSPSSSMSNRSAMVGAKSAISSSGTANNAAAPASGGGGMDCLIVAITHENGNTVPPGLLRAKVQLLAAQIQDSLSSVAVIGNSGSEPSQTTTSMTTSY
jgi:hypothetical protein